jgi:hypothetical protein
MVMGDQRNFGDYSWGNAFPTNHIAGRIYYRRDLGVWVHDDGTYWLGPPITIMIPFATNNGANPTSWTATTLISRFGAPSAEAYLVERVTWFQRVVSGTWTLRLGHEGNTFGGSVDKDVSGATGVTPVTGTNVSNQPVDFSTSSGFDYFLEVRNISAGQLDLWSVEVVMRKVYT